MAVFRTKGRDEILLRMVARMVARSRYTDVAAGSGLMQNLGAVAREVEDTFIQIANLLDLFDPDNLDPDALDSWAVIVAPDGVPARRGASNATGAVLLGTVGVANVPVPRGTILGAGAILFEVTASVTVPAGGTVTAPIQAVVPGVTGNVGAGQVIRIVTSLAGLDTCTNPTALTNGEDQESNSSFMDRIKRFMRSLARVNPSSLESLAMTIGVTSHADGLTGDPVKVYEDTTPVVRRVRYAKLVEDEIIHGVSTLYIDEGTGFLAVPVGQLYAVHTSEVLTASAAGGERRFRAAHWPCELGTAFILQRWPAGGGAYATLTEGLDYTINRSNGRIVLSTALTSTDKLQIFRYTTSLDLVWAVQYAVEGSDPRTSTWPGWRGAGLVIFVRRPTVVPIDVTGILTVAYGYDMAAAQTLVKAAVTAYLNTLPIGANVIWAQLIEEAMAVAGVTNVILSTPTADVAIPDQNVARAGAINF